MPPKTLARFFRYIDRSTDPNGCWIWTGYLNPPGKPRGRRGQNLHPRPRFLVASGHFTEDGHRVGQVHVYAARLILSLASGQSLEAMRGMDVHHACGNRRCVCPWHLELITPADHRVEHDAERFGTFL